MTDPKMGTTEPNVGMTDHKAQAREIVNEWARQNRDDEWFVTLAQAIAAALAAAEERGRNHWSEEDRQAYFEKLYNDGRREALESGYIDSAMRIAEIIDLHGGCLIKNCDVLNRFEQDVAKIEGLKAEDKKNG